MEPGDVKFRWRNSYCNNGMSDAYSNYRGFPKFSQKPDDWSEIEEGYNWVWSVRIKGGKPLTVELYQDGELRLEKTYNGKMTMFEATMYEVSAEDEGYYELFVTNYRGTVSLHHQLYVI